MSNNKPTITLKAEPEYDHIESSQIATSNQYNKLPLANPFIAEPRNSKKCCAHQEELKHFKSETFKMTEVLMKRHQDEIMLVSSLNAKLLESENFLLNENRILKETLKNYEEYFVNCSVKRNHSSIGNSIQLVNHKRTSDTSFNESSSKRPRIDEDVYESFSDEEFLLSKHINLIVKRFFYIFLYKKFSYRYRN